MSIKLLISGGLGNQMFQYAAARAVALRASTDLIIDTRFYSEDVQKGPMRFCIDDFPIVAKVVKYRNHFVGPHSPARRLVRALVTERPSSRYHNPRLGYHTDCLEVADGTTVSGYFQSESYFEEYSDLIRRELELDTFPESLAVSIQNTEHPVVSIHVRRGDYLVHEGFLLADQLSYYESAIQLMLEHEPKSRFLLFSDDVSWCRHQAIFKACEFHERKDGADHRLDLLAMSRCTHHIIANSSFSWWGAWLNSSKDKIVVAPRYWFGGQETRDLNIVPDKWVVI